MDLITAYWKKHEEAKPLPILRDGQYVTKLNFGDGIRLTAENCRVLLAHVQTHFMPGEHAAQIVQLTSEHLTDGIEQRGQQNLEQLTLRPRLWPEEDQSK